MDMNADRVSRLDQADWVLIMEVLDAARPEDHPGQEVQIRGLAAVLRQPSNRPLCSQCDGSAADRWLANGLCPMCHLSNSLAERLPEEFDGDESQESILERAVHVMANTWENAKKLREQCEREESSAFTGNWYLWTREIRNLMGWLETDANGSFTRYHYAGQPEKTATACGCDYHGDHAACNSACECAR